jgi:signal transduction histidine kinase
MGLGAIGGDTEVIGTVMDVTERKQKEMAVLQYQQELRTLTARLIENQEMASAYMARELRDDFSQKLDRLIATDITN